jgi:hypothetical protein
MATQLPTAEADQRQPLAVAIMRYLRKPRLPAGLFCCLATSLDFCHVAMSQNQQQVFVSGEDSQNSGSEHSVLVDALGRRQFETIVIRWWVSLDLYRNRL